MIKTMQNSNYFARLYNNTKTQIVECNMSIKQCTIYTNLKLKWQIWLHNFTNCQDMMDKHKQNKMSWDIIQKHKLLSLT
jgi:hypothetical protein